VRIGHAGQRTDGRGSCGRRDELGCRHLFSDDHDGVEIQAYCGMIACMLILIYTGEKPNRAMEQMVWYYLIGLASLKELEAFIKRA
jgi:hypothetical protein